MPRAQICSHRVSSQPYAPTTDLKPVAWSAGSVLWCEAVFEKGSVQVALVVKEGEEAILQLLKDYQPGKPWQVIGDLHFYRPKASKAP